MPNSTLIVPSDIWDRMDMRGPDECWPWLRSTNSAGYGNFWCDGKTRPAHRVAYELARGPIPPGMQLDHLCRNRLCCNPDHLEPVTQRENIRRGSGPSADNARKTRCVNGHLLAGTNLFIAYGGRRRCHECRRNRLRSR